MVVLYGTVDQEETESLITDIIMKGWKDKVWIIDKQNPVSQLLQVLQRANGDDKPVLVYESNKVKRIIIGQKKILNFFKQHGFALLDISDKKYY